MDPQDPLATSLAEKISIFTKSLLVNCAEAGDVPLDTPTMATSSIQFPTLTPDEIKTATFRAGNTSPGPDEITTTIIRLAWLLIKIHVCHLFTLCQSMGYHPLCFRHTVLFILSKPNKTDHSSPRSYHPIALSSVLGKGLERIMTQETHGF